MIKELSNKKSNRAAIKIEARCNTYSPEIECIYFEPLTDKTPTKKCKFFKENHKVISVPIWAEGCPICTCKEAIEDALRKRLNGYT